jgi:hypothetical protein
MLENRSVFWCIAVVSQIVLVNIAQAIDTFAEVKAAYFRPSDDKFRRIYNEGAIYGGEVSCQAWKNLYGWASANYFHKSGTSIGRAGGNTTNITFVPLGLGLKYLFPIRFVDVYAGGGILSTYLHMDDHSHHVIKSNSKWGVGGIVKAGAIFNVDKHFFIDLFSDYSFMKVDFHNTHGGKVVRHDADLSGWSIGLGIGYRFGKKTGNSHTRCSNAGNSNPNQDGDINCRL